MALRRKQYQGNDAHQCAEGSQYRGQSSHEPAGAAYQMPLVARLRLSDYDASRRYRWTTESRAPAQSSAPTTPHLQVVHKRQLQDDDEDNHGACKPRVQLTTIQMLVMLFHLLTGSRCPFTRYRFDPAERNERTLVSCGKETSVRRLFPAAAETV